MNVSTIDLVLALVWVGLSIFFEVCSKRTSHLKYSVVSLVIHCLFLGWLRFLWTSTECYGLFQALVFLALLHAIPLLFMNPRRAEQRSAFRRTDG